MSAVNQTGPAKGTIGPHDGSVANVVDPRVQPDPTAQGNRKAGDETGPAAKTTGPHRSDIANVLDPRVQPNPEELKAKEKHREGKSVADNEPTAGEQKGVRGLIHKFDPKK